MKENLWPIVVATVLAFILSLGYLFIEQRGYFAPANHESANIAVTTTPPLQIASRDPGGIAKIVPVKSELSLDIKYVYRRKAGGDFNTLTDNTILYSGDYYKIIFTPTEKTYVYIFQQGSSGSIYRLFPMTSFGGVTVNNFNPAQSGTEYHIPAKDKSFFLDDQTGTEKLYFIASRQKEEKLENQYQQVLIARRGKDTHKIQLAQATLTKSIKMRDPGGIESDSTQTETFSFSDKEGEQFTVIRDRLKSCDGCLSEVTFLHR
ncbi:DUF4384 domain-containing protein [Candidatus Parabeggiatoa sp. HSG14]|uniref:DUF4384 domain-containing protein n=1 Tax=Candidatus Parabeggiatoa sp. HSG14 TaxID=3055593 RepID=UPI0025A770A3|nr:DUF4384 domain-containing protein [Thiotrichales bacterium HSG14]